MIVGTTASPATPDRTGKYFYTDVGDIGGRQEMNHVQRNGDHILIRGEQMQQRLGK